MKLSLTDKIKRFFGLYKGEFEVVYSVRGTWNVKSGDGTYNEFSHYKILYNEYTEKYILKCEGYDPESHGLYTEVFKYMRMLNEGLAYVKGGSVYTYEFEDENKINGKNITDLNETECNAHLKKAIEDENYELAEKIKKRLEAFK